MTERILGVDLSQTGLGLAVVPVDWDLLWHRCETIAIGYGLPRAASNRALIERTGKVVRAAVSWIARRDITEVWIEGYPASGRAYNLVMEAEVGGVFRVELLRRLGIAAYSAPMTTARKLLLGKLPRKDVKKHLHRMIRDAGCPFTTGDELDAWVAANYGLSERGYPCVAQAA